MENINVLKINDFKFIEFKCDEVGIYFSTSEGSLDFNKNNEIGIKNLANLKKWFNVNNIGYLNQVHSDDIYTYDSLKHDGDAIITNEKGVAIGVFTADCVPVLIYDKRKYVIGAIHSGWKGTLNCIVSKTIEKMVDNYGSDIGDLQIFIGPHNSECCYEVSEELIEMFKSSDVYKKANINNGRKLSLAKCIKKQAQDKFIKNEQIHMVNMCTYCSKDYKFHSYRREKEKSGRMFSFIFIK